MDDVALGFGLGFLVALQLGPMSLFLIRTTLRSGLPTGLAVGAGVAVVDALYAAAGSAGAAPLLQVDGVRLAVGLGGAAVLLLLGVRTLLAATRVRAGEELELDAATPRRAFATSLGATASNPLTVVSWAALFSAASVGAGAAAVPLVAGVALGSATWMALLATGVAWARRGVGPRAVRVVDVVAGLGLVGYGVAMAVRTARGEGQPA